VWRPGPLTGMWVRGRLLWELPRVRSYLWGDHGECYSCITSGGFSAGKKGLLSSESWVGKLVLGVRAELSSSRKGAGSLRFSVASCISCSCHEQKAYGAKFITPDKSLFVSLSMVRFVDDSSPGGRGMILMRIPNQVKKSSTNACNMMRSCGSISYDSRAGS
jgi:hypothetical protein